MRICSSVPVDVVLGWPPPPAEAPILALGWPPPERFERALRGSATSATPAKTARPPRLGARSAPTWPSDGPPKRPPVPPEAPSGGHASRGGGADLRGGVGQKRLELPTGEGVRDFWEFGRTHQSLEHLCFTRKTAPCPGGLGAVSGPSRDSLGAISAAAAAGAGGPTGPRKQPPGCLGLARSHRKPA